MVVARRLATTMQPRTLVARGCAVVAWGHANTKSLKILMKSSVVAWLH